MAQKRKMRIAVLTVFGTAAICLAAWWVGSNVYDRYFREWDQPVHVYLNGSVYVHHGYDVDELPSDCKMVGRTHNIGNDNTGVDLDSNADGYVYMAPGDLSKAYFWYRTWDEQADGVQAYLILNQETNEP